MVAGRAREHHRTSRGAATVEFALVVPFLLLLVFAIISYGYMLSFRQSVSQGTSEGARAAAITTSTTQNAAQKAAIQALNQTMNSYSVTCAIPDTVPATTTGTLTRNSITVGSCAVVQATCTNTPANLPTSQCMSVTVDYDYKNNPLVPAFPGIGLLMPNSLHFTSTVEVN